MKILKSIGSAIFGLAVTYIFASGISALDVTVNGEPVDFPDQQPVVSNDRTLVPVRFIAEELGYSVEWNEADDSAVIDNGRIVFYIGTDKAVINGEPITLDTESTLINDRTMVPLRVVAETLDCTVDWFERIETVHINSKNADGSEKNIWERFMQSGMFTLSEDYATGFYGNAVLGDTFDTSKLYSWYLKRNGNMLNYDPNYECEIYVMQFDDKALSEIREMLMVIYPYGYDEVYDLMIKSIRGELWECMRDEVKYLASGTFGTHYIDGREVNIYVSDGLSHMAVKVRKAGYVNPETPKVFDEATIANLTSRAREYYRFKDRDFNYEGTK